VKRKTVIVAVILAAVVMVVSSKLLMASISSGAVLANFEIINKGLSSSLDGLDHDVDPNGSRLTSPTVFYVYATVRNNGKPGNVTIFATFTQNVMEGAHVSAQSRILYLKSGESQEVTFKFSTSYIFPAGEPTGLRGGVNPGANPIHPETSLLKGFSYEVWVQP
jgi:hypothetical protein